MSAGVVDGYPRQVWWNTDGETVVESYTITDMAHGTPLGIADNEQRYGAQGAFLIEAGISSSYHIAKFFGLTEWIREAKTEKAEAKPAVTKAAKPQRKPVAKPAAKPVAAAPAIPPVSMPDLAEVLWPLTTLRARPEPKDEPRRRGIDVSAVITRALTAAGLMK
jgi:hypothetical protein